MHEVIVINAIKLVSIKHQLLFMSPRQAINIQLNG